MGAGDYAAGAGDAGEDVLPDVGPARQVTPPVALKFDGRTADFLLDANGRYLSSHPVDQRVALRLIVREGTVASVPGLGNRLRSIKRASGAQAISQATDYVNLALAEIIAAGDISLDNVQVEYPQRGQIAIVVSWTNLRTLPPRSNTVRVNH
jgi:hypothetical protein